MSVELKRGQGGRWRKSVRRSNRSECKAHRLHHQMRVFPKRLQRTIEAEAASCVQAHRRRISGSDTQTNAVHPNALGPRNRLLQQSSTGPHSSRCRIDPHLEKVGDSRLIVGQLAPDQTAGVAAIEREEDTILPRRGSRSNSIGPHRVGSRGLCFMRASEGVRGVEQRPQTHVPIGLPFIRFCWVYRDQKITFWLRAEGLNLRSVRQQNSAHRPPRGRARWRAGRPR